MTTAPADPAATSTPEPRPRPGQPLTAVQRVLVGIVIALVLVIAAIGFAGSYAAVSHLAEAKGFGRFAAIFPIGLDSGIGAFLALDLLLTWLRIPFPLLRYGAWVLTIATVAFNAAAAWPDPLGVGMHAVIPVLFVIAVEAARHAIGRIADITADKHIESPPVSRWIVAFPSTLLIWRRQRKHNIRSYEAVLDHQRQIHVYRARLRKDHGRRWRREAPAEKLLVLRLAAGGMTVADAIALPELEARKREADRLARLEAARLEEADRLQALEDQRRIEEKARIERARIQREEEAEAARLESAQRIREEEEDRHRRIAEAETHARLDEIQREQDTAQEENDRRLRAEKLAHAQELAEAEERRCAAASKTAQSAEQASRAATEAARQAERKSLLEQAAILEQQRAVAQAASGPASASASRAASGPASASPAGSPTTVGTGTGRTANANAGSVTTGTANGPANEGPIDTTEVVAAYQHLKQQLGKDPSDAALGQRLGVSRSRAQQLRTAAIEAGHTELAKTLRVA